MRLASSWLPKDCFFNTIKRKHFLGTVYRSRQWWMTFVRQVTLSKESCSRTTPLPFRTGYGLVIFFRGNSTLYPGFPLPEADQDACPLGSSPIFPNHSHSSGRRTGGGDISWVNRPLRVGMWLFAMHDPGNESWSTSLTILPSYGKHIIRKSEETIASMQYM